MLRPFADFEKDWALLHSTLSVDYTLPTKLLDRATSEKFGLLRVTADCNEIAQRIAIALIQRDMSPTALFITSPHVITRAMAGNEVAEDDFPTLTPKLIRPKKAWTHHIVCEASGLVYDPVFEGPLPQAEYLVQMFEGEVSVHPIV